MSIRIDIQADDEEADRLNENGGWVVSVIGTVKSTITVASGYDATVAERAFWLLVEQRVAEKARAGFLGRPDPKTGVQERVVFIPWHFEAGEPSVYGDELVCEFTYVYRVTNTRLSEVVLHTGLWEETGDDWDKWRVSVQASALNPRGSTGLVFRPQDDQIVDLCGEYPNRLKAVGGTRQPRLLGLNAIPFPPPDEATSWILYRCTCVVEVDGGAVEGRVLAQRAWQRPGGQKDVEMRVLKGFGTVQLAPPQKTPQLDDVFARLTGVSAPAFGRGGGGTVVPGGGRGGKGNPPPPDVAVGKADPKPGELIIQRRTAPFAVLYLVGEALRVGFDIPPPKPGPVNGVQPVPMNRLDMGEGFASAVVGTTANGLPVYGAKWRLRYVLPQVPEGPIPVPQPLGVPQPKG